MKKTVIFDLDGTLLDSIEDIASSMNKVLESLKLPIHKIEDYKYFVGGGVDILVENALNNHSKEIKDEVTKRFKVEYDGKLHSKTLPYDGIYDLLDELKKLEINDILYAESKGHILLVYLKDGTYFQTRLTLGRFLEMVNNYSPGQFASPGKGYIVNLLAIHVIKSDCIEVQGKYIPLAKGKFREFQENYFKAMSQQTVDK
jgi:hypothetical protein